MEDEEALRLMRAAVAAHKAHDLLGAENGYRDVLKIGHHAGAAVLLANLLLAKAAEERDCAAAASAREDALQFSRSCLKGITERPVAEQWKLYARYGYFLLQYSGYVQGAGERKVPQLPAGQREALLAEAIDVLTKATTLAPDFLLGWRNLTLALTAAERFEEAASAAGSAVKASGASASWEMLYRHGKALKRAGREEDALSRYCDSVEASQGKEETPLFWLRVASAEDTEAEQRKGKGGHPRMPPALVSRIRSLLTRYDSSSGNGNASTLVPHDYIRKLFDGYSSRFEEHLTQHLGYRTPSALLAMALDVLPEGLIAPPDRGAGVPGVTGVRRTVTGGPLWQRAGDLGCGTGLAGVAFRPYVAWQAGCDLSSGMVGEARRRGGVYEELETAEVVAWLKGRERSEGSAEDSSAHSSSSSPSFPGFDLLVCADVLVYIGDLKPVFTAAGKAMIPSGSGGSKQLSSSTAAPHAAAAAGGGEVTAVGGEKGTALPPVPSLFVFSTEAFGPLEQEGEEEGSSASTTLSPAGAVASSAAGGGTVAPPDTTAAAAAAPERVGYHLTGTGRCSHARWYIRSLAAENGFKVLKVSRQAIRKNAGEDVVGDLYVLERVAASC